MRLLKLDCNCLKTCTCFFLIRTVWTRVCDNCVIRSRNWPSKLNLNNHSSKAGICTKNHSQFMTCCVKKFRSWSIVRNISFRWSNSLLLRSDFWNWLTRTYRLPVNVWRVVAYGLLRLNFRHQQWTTSPVLYTRSFDRTGFSLAAPPKPA